MSLEKSIGSHSTPCLLIEMSEPTLNVFNAIECCPDCGCLTKKGTLRCPECGLFHYDITSLPERDPPPISSNEVIKQDLDPSLYSLNPNLNVPLQDDSEEHEDVTVDWTDSTTDFTLPRENSSVVTPSTGEEE